MEAQRRGNPAGLRVSWGLLEEVWSSPRTQPCTWVTQMKVGFLCCPEFLAKNLHFWGSLVYDLGLQRNFTLIDQIWVWSLVALEISPWPKECRPPIWPPAICWMWLENVTNTFRQSVQRSQKKTMGGWAPYWPVCIELEGRIRSWSMEKKEVWAQRWRRKRCEPRGRTALFWISLAL